MDNELRSKVVKAVTKKAMAEIIPVPITTEQSGEIRVEERKLEAIAPKTGYSRLDQHIRGWIPGHLYVLTGETNAGKTAAACNFICRVAKQDKKVVYFALEPDVGVSEYIAGIYHRKRWSEITDQDLLTHIPGISIFTKESHAKLDQLLHTIEAMDRQDLIVVDHIGYFTSNSEDGRSQTQQESDAIKRIVGVAKKKKTAVMIIAHPRKPAGKNNKNTPLTMNEISGSASFKQDATDILILHMDKDEGDKYGLTNAPTGTILLPKVKTGKSGSINIYFVPESPVMLEGEEAGHIIAEGF